MEIRSKISLPTKITSPSKPPRDSKIADSPKPTKSNNSVEVARVSSDRPKETQQPSLSSEPQERAKEEKVEPISKEHIQALFSGAPCFALNEADGRTIPVVSFPWDEELRVKDVSDSVQLPQPAFSAATLHRHLPILQESSDQEKKYLSYDVGVVEVPSMLSAQGIEPGSIGFVHFLELPASDNLVTDLQQSQSSNGFLESVRNKEQMQSNPERLGIRLVDMQMIHDRLVEFGDLIEVFQDSPERMTLLNNQSSGDLYANLFGKFLTPPGYDDSSADDPTGIKVQIDTLLKILRLKGIWYDFSLVEWRIRLGQILWSDPDAVDEVQSPQLWSERDILLLQITLACELLLRLDAVTSMDVDDVKSQMRVKPEDFQSFLKLKTRKTEWDLVLARRFLDNILIVKESDATSAQTPKSRGLLSMLSKPDPKGASTAEPDLVFLPRHQVRQLLGLVYFAETIQWPELDLIFKDLAQKLGVAENNGEKEQQPASPYGKFLDPSTPSSVSVYGTPLATPRSASGMRDSYFGHVSRPVVSRSNSRSLTVPLSTTLVTHVNDAAKTLNIGGWLSRSYLTGLILPGEAISHFLMSTLLENDKLAIAALGDSANLYGGFIYTERSWWSKSCIVGRVLACLEGAVECMGWISFAKVPAGFTDGWYVISSEQLQHEQQPRITSEEDMVARDSAIIPGGIDNEVKPEELALPLDSERPPIPSIELTEWKLQPVVAELPDNEEASGSPSETETHTATLTFTSVSRPAVHTIALRHDVQFVTSFPCTPPSTTPPPNSPQILKKSLSRSSSKRSSLNSARSGRLSRHPSRRNSHGFEPLLSHPPDSPGIAPTRVYSPIPDEEPEDKAQPAVTKPEPMMAHPLHVSYKYKIVPMTDVLDPNFSLPFKVPKYTSPAPSNPNTPKEEKQEANQEQQMVLILDVRASKDLELLGRAWCAEKGLHALIGRVGRTCLACCIREARGLGINIVIRA